MIPLTVPEERLTASTALSWAILTEEIRACAVDIHFESPLKTQMDNDLKQVRAG